MILLTSGTSPFGRKVKIAALAHGLSGRLTIEKADPWTEGPLTQANPIGKMPTLIMPDQTVIYDSGVILDVFDTLLERPRLFPTERAIETRVFHALGNGLIEAALLITYERMRRPAEYCYEPWVRHQALKLERGLTSLVAHAPDPREADAGAIAVACALGYLDWRKQIDWRSRFPEMVAWLNTFEEACPAYEATRAEH